MVSRVNELDFVERFGMELRCKTDNVHHERMVVFLWFSLVICIVLYSVKEGTKFLHLGKE